MIPRQWVAAAAASVVPIGLAGIALAMAPESHSAPSPTASRPAPVSTGTPGIERASRTEWRVLPGPTVTVTKTPEPAPTVTLTRTVVRTATALATVRVTVTPRASRSTVRPVSESGSTIWDALAKCESGGNWHINTGNGFYGGIQFTLQSWHAMGGTGRPDQASRSEQILRAQKLQAVQGWGAWPVCSQKIGVL